MNGARIRQWLLRGAVIAGGAGALFVATMGFAHTRAGRPLLALMARTRTLHIGSCPLGYDKAASPGAREAARVAFAKSHRGRASAERRPALGFELDVSSPAEITAYMAAHHVACRASTGLADLVCDNVPSTALPVDLGVTPPRDLWFNFGVDARLISVVGASRAPAAPSISAAFSAATAVVAQGAGGSPTKVEGDPAAPALAAGLLRQASAEFRFSNYYASARATNMGNGFLLTEEYRSLPN